MFCKLGTSCCSLICRKPYRQLTERDIYIQPCLTVRFFPFTQQAIRFNRSWQQLPRNHQSHFGTRISTHSQWQNNKTSSNPNNKLNNNSSTHLPLTLTPTLSQLKKMAGSSLTSSERRDKTNTRTAKRTRLNHHTHTTSRQTLIDLNRLRNFNKV